MIGKIKLLQSSKDCASNNVKLIIDLFPMILALDHG